jgi:hypothetical protein
MEPRAAASQEKQHFCLITGAHNILHFCAVDVETKCFNFFRQSALLRLRSFYNSALKT